MCVGSFCATPTKWGCKVYSTPAVSQRPAEYRLPFLLKTSGTQDTGPALNGSSPLFVEDFRLVTESGSGMGPGLGAFLSTDA